MRKNIKQMTAIVLSMGLTVTGSMVSYAANAADAGNFTTAAGSTEYGATSTLTGTIKVSTLKVSVPLTVTFDMDPSTYDADQGTAWKAAWTGITGPTNYTIKNDSALDVYVYITKFEQADGTVKQGDVTITSDKALIGTNTTRTVAMAIKDAAETMPGFDTLTADYWLTPQTQKYMLNTTSKGLLKATDGATGGDDEMTLKIYGMTYKGWSKDDTFAVKPTFTVSLTAPS